jgi:DNA-binding MarR family transcriptional regulator
MAAPQNTKGVDVTKNLTYRIVLLASTLSRSASRALPREAGISVAEWRILSVIGSRPNISFNALVQTLDIDKGWISRTLAQLEKDAYVVKTPDPQDKRQFQLSLSARGKELHLKGSGVSRQRQRQLEAAFSASELRALEALLDRLQKAAERLD